MGMPKRIQSLEELYFQWLARPILDSWEVQGLDEVNLKTIHRMKFDAIVTNDLNRALDGVALREEFLYEHGVKSSPWEIQGWLMFPCTMLEMLIALADRAAFQTDKSPEFWFGIFMKNLRINESSLYHALQRLNERQYDYDGTGGLFPLRNPLEDQRGVELWYQMSAYIMENFHDEGVYRCSIS